MKAIKTIVLLLLLAVISPFVGFFLVCQLLFHAHLIALKAYQALIEWL